MDEELEALQQEELDNKMLTTGTVPVGDKVGALPAAPQGGLFYQPCCSLLIQPANLTFLNPVKGKSPAQAEDDEEEELRKLQAEMAM